MAVKSWAELNKQFGASTPTASKPTSVKSWDSVNATAKPAPVLNKGGVDVSWHAFNPLNPTSQKNLENITKGTTTKTSSNFGKALTEGSTYVALGKEVKSAVKTLAVDQPKGIYNAFTKPSTAEQETERQIVTKLNLTQPSSQIVAKFLSRLASTVTEPYATLLGKAKSDTDTANKVAAGGYGTELLN